MLDLSRILLLAALVGACGDDSTLSPDAGDSRRVMATAEVAASGRSSSISFDVPSGTRSVTIVVEGAAGALYALAGLTLADGEDRVALPDVAIEDVMQASYYDEQIGQMPGGLHQSIRLGTFTQVYPYRPDQQVVAGPATIEIASDTAGPVDITIVMPADDGAQTLHLNVVVVSDTLVVAALPGFASTLASVLAQADIEVVIDAVSTRPGTGLDSITDFSEPQEPPSSQAASLPALIMNSGSPALDVFIVESLPLGVGGLSLGTPGPPLRGSYYYGVVVRPGASDADTAEVIAHELCHFLALQHVQNSGISGALYPDPLDDTEVGVPNLMAGTGTLLTADQRFALRRSALLVP
jgi:hypothetical protein